MKKNLKKSEPKKETTSEPDIHGEVRAKKTVKRQTESKDFKDIMEHMPTDEKTYKSINIAKANKYINEALDKAQDEGRIEDLAMAMVNNDSPFNAKIQQLAAFKVADRLRSMAEKEGNEMQKNALDKLAADVMIKRNTDINIAATQTALEAEVAKMLPLSESGLKDYTQAAMSQVQNTYLSEKQQGDIKEAVTDINKLLETVEAQKAIKNAVESEIDRIAIETKGKEWVDKLNSAMDDLKIDLTDC